jgi:hypothetical protein
MYRIENIKIREDFEKEELIEYICKKYKINMNTLKKWNIVKKSIDARKKEDIFYNYTIDIETNQKLKKFKIIKEEQNIIPEFRNIKMNKRPVIIGAGPSGLFCALILARAGVKPIVVEQGKKVEERINDVESFRKEGKINSKSNVQFGEGGAGTFSDGKLTSNINNAYSKKVIQEFYNFGAPEQILYTPKPHIGTDNLIEILKNIRNEIINLGGTFFYNEKMIDFELKDNKIKSITTEKRQIETDNLILAIGHSARDTFYKLYEKNIEMKRKNFSIGLRIEHLQNMINEAQYGKFTKLKLPPAEYKMAYHAENGRTCYTFCMCPGGEVIASSSDEKTIVTNGMSKYARNGKNSNSAILVNITTEDVGEGNNPLKGIEFQKKLEESAFKLGGENYYAPVQRVEDFLNNVQSTSIGAVKPTYLPGYKLTNLNEILPEFISETLKEGIKYFDKKIKGFANPDAILTAIETRSSSPVTIIRNEKYESNVKGIYPCGEGAGYAGGITTSAVDGIKCAIAVIESREYNLN